MFWTFGFNKTSAINGIIDKEGSAVDELLNEDELIQEVKALSTKLIDLYELR